jgi:WD domain, G-beta repeat.
MPNDNLPQESEAMKLECLIDSRTLLKNSNNRISTLACTNNYLACGTFEGGYILSDVADPNDSKLLGEFHITRNGDGITNHIIINEAQKALLISSNDRTFRSIDMATNSTLHLIELPFAINCAAINKQNVNEVFIAGDHVNAFIIDKRNQDFKSSIAFQGHQDFGFSCDWSTSNDNLLVTGNQDSCVRLWDKRKPSSSLYCWSGALGSRSSANTGAPIRNCKFSYNSEFVSWAESLDHVGLIKLEDLQPDSALQTWAQSIDFIGKCTGLNFAPIENGFGEQLVIGVNDCPLGGILSYKLESKSKSLDFDFQF